MDIKDLHDKNRAFALPNINLKVTRSINSEYNDDDAIANVQDAIVNNNDMHIRYEADSKLFTMKSLNEDDAIIKPLPKNARPASYDFMDNTTKTYSASNSIEISSFSFTNNENVDPMTQDYPEVRTSSLQDVESGRFNKIQLEKVQKFIADSSLDQPFFTGLDGIIGEYDPINDGCVVAVTTSKSSYTYYPIDDIKNITLVISYRCEDNSTGESTTMLEIYKLSKNSKNQLDMIFYKSYCLDVSFLTQGSFIFPLQLPDGSFDTTNVIMLTKKMIFTLIRCIDFIVTGRCPKLLEFQNDILLMKTNPNAGRSFMNRILKLCNMDDDQFSFNGMTAQATKMVDAALIDRTELLIKYGYTKDVNGVQLDPLAWLTANILSRIDLFSSFDDLECKTKYDKTYANLAYFNAFKSDLGIKRCSEMNSRAHKDIESMKDFKRMQYNDED